MNSKAAQHKKEVANKLEQRDKINMIMVSDTNWPGIMPILARRELDLIIFELEHSRYSWSELEALIRASLNEGLPSIVRVVDITYEQISKSLDMGARGILIPRIESFEQLEQVVDMMRLPPKGRKGVGGYDFAVDDLQQKLANYNVEKLLFIQVENPTVVKQLDRMLKLNEIVGVIVGPYDLSVSLGIPGQFDHPLFERTVEEVYRICDHNGISCGMFMQNEATIRKWRAKGMNILWTGTDLAFFIDGYNRICDVVDSID
jgi:2-keto-3-deoxy-L-rhamnonate aldolase RhmA